MPYFNTIAVKLGTFLQNRSHIFVRCAYICYEKNTQICIFNACIKLECCMYFKKIKWKELILLIVYLSSPFILLVMDINQSLS